MEPSKADRKLLKYSGIVERLAGAHRSNAVRQIIGRLAAQVLADPRTGARHVAYAANDLSKDAVV